MLWVVDGTRLKKDYSRFRKGKESLFFKKTNNENVFIVEYPDNVFSSNWLNSSVPVVFDFLGLSTDTSDEDKNALWCLVPRQEDGKTYVLSIKRDLFIKVTNNSPTLPQTMRQPSQVLQRQHSTILNSRPIHRRPLIDWIEQKQSKGTWKPRRKK